jgi:hypothetical protein
LQINCTQLCTYHLGLITKNQTTNENIKNTRRHYPGGVEPGKLENCRVFFVSPQRPSYVGSDGGLLSSASDAMDMQEVASNKQRQEYMDDMEAFAAGTGTIADAARDGSPHVLGSPRADRGQRSADAHNPLPM